MPIPPTADRVESASTKKQNATIYEKTVNQLTQIMVNSTDKQSSAIENRLNKLSREWDMERLLEFNASTLLVISGFLAYFHCKHWLILTLAVACFLWQHAVQGWCPPVPIFRSIFQIRTAAEIFTEKTALKLLRGDFQSVSKVSTDQINHENAASIARQCLDAADLHCYNDHRQYQRKQF